MPGFTFSIAAAVCAAVFIFSDAVEAADSEALTKNQIKEQLKTVTVEERAEAISRADVFVSKISRIHNESPQKISEVDMVQELVSVCGPQYSYSNKAEKPNVGWPTLDCTYHQDNRSLSGATRKFYCTFKEKNKKGEEVLKRRKVKYTTFFRISKSELVPTIMASTMASLLGFHTERYCPAKIRCQNCPSSDPWEDNRASAPPSNETHEFDYAMVEMPADLMTITPNTPRESEFVPHGLKWEELKLVKDTESKTARERAIEREAWLLWVNFLADTDALFFNQRISCDKVEIISGKAFCLKPVVYGHDYGHAFHFRFNYERWRVHAPLLSAENGTCRGGLTDKLLKSERGKSQDGLHVSPVISAEARDLLVSRMRNVSDKQWRDIMRISNAPRLYRDVSPDDFVQAMKAKIEFMSQVQCAGFDSKTSVLSLH
jgi:hypothetical protein